MYNSSRVADTIKALAKSKNISLRGMFLEIGLGVNTMSNMKTSMPKADNLARIADYLDCSVDYLLGRTDCPEVARSGNSSIKIAAEGHSEHVIEMKPEQVEALKQALAQLPNE